ncbi:acyltransferase family protein [Variovorax sp. J22G73]|uniref:acyltransferase family protein n=1 Tax=unclassified Variovorax TaxID=663243 RepID=UPI002576FF48|nr:MULTISPECIES: acyltransferase family protein [unclassified Variovorax]MDM0009178.1 acyltransferase family protein [Variovorax sp. J22R203]MDM0101685.1 acyltransferase family protein [Variovorax sp. J22G73]
MNNACIPSTPPTPAAPQRLHALDNLRALMMWLGIVLHVAINHLTVDSPLPWRDPQTSRVADLLLLFIHSFRMPVFFVLAGFFVALLVERRGAGGMLKNRALRLALPFALFWPPLFAATTLLTMVYIHLTARGVPGIDSALTPARQPGGSPFNTMHLWFLYQLFWFSVLAGAGVRLRRFVPTRQRDAVARGFAVLAQRRWGFVVLALPLAITGAFHPSGFVTESGSFLPSFSEWLQSGLFFVFGWYLHRDQERLLARLAARCKGLALGGLAFFVATLALLGALHGQAPYRLPHAEFWIAFAYNATSWLWSLALIGGFVRYVPRQNAVLTYLSQSSYWVYLVHMLGTIGFGILLFHAPFGALTKMGLNIAATSLVALASYQLLVRRTPLGTLLNGQRTANRSTRKSTKARVFAAR